jgi:lipopolysaccharide transport system ATP-binding protein
MVIFAFRILQHLNNNIAISVKNLSKRYSIGKQKDSSLRGTLNGIFNNPASTGEEFWALKNVSFEINKGEVVGIIGKNGAGKSTLLKILSQITKPSEGRIEINGRIASLLEVGTGFHPELTGRENIYLNGTILGMTRKEVKAKFDEIVEFSGVEKFIDTPVKHYSSGMYVRLAFAVAAHLDPEILIIDEVLAVGDASFQKKCLGKMGDIAKQGRTVLFVSHDLGAVSSLCSKGIFMKNGQLILHDKIDAVIKKYMDSDGSTVSSSKKYSLENYQEYDGTIELLEVKIVDEQSQEIQNFYVNQEIAVEIVFKVLDDSNIHPIPNIHLIHGMGGKILVSVNTCETNAFHLPGEYKSIVKFPANFFNNGFFTLGIAISSLDPVIVHVADYNALSFEVLDVLDATTRNGYTGKMDGYLRPLLTWENTKSET